MIQSSFHRKPEFLNYLGKAGITSEIFRVYNADTFEHLKRFAQFFNLTIVDSYWSYDKRYGHHVPTIETFSLTDCKRTEEQP
jgi:hypothetical protein